MSARNDDADLLERPVRHSASRSGRTRPGHRHRRPMLLLAALIAGGLGAGVISFQGPSQAAAESTSVRDAQEALATSDEDVQLMPMASITEAEAQARLAEVAA